MEKALDVGNVVIDSIAFPQIRKLPIGGQNLSTAKVAATSTDPGMI